MADSAHITTAPAANVIRLADVRPRASDFAAIDIAFDDAWLSKHRLSLELAAALLARDRAGLTAVVRAVGDPRSPIIADSLTAFDRTVRQFEGLVAHVRLARARLCAVTKVL